MGMLGYNVDKIINVMDIQDVKTFKTDFITMGSVVRKAYQAGKDKADFIIDIKLFELAKQGDIKALEKFEQRRSPIATLTARQLKHAMSSQPPEVIKVPEEIKRHKPTATIKKRNPPVKTKASTNGDSKTTVARKRTTTKKVNS